jgi:predicted metal-dependent peptidase
MNIASPKDGDNAVFPNWYQFVQSFDAISPVFYQLVNMGEPRLTDSIERAAVVFDRDGLVREWLICPSFWDGLDDHTKRFVVCHECLHALLNHGKRFKGEPLRDLANVAMDLAINHNLIKYFGFDRKRIKDGEIYCWVDTCFPPDKIPSDNLTAEQYLTLLKENVNEITIGMLVDSHDGFSDADTEATQEAVASRLSREELEEFNELVEDSGEIKGENKGEEKKNKQAGKAPGNSFFKVPPKYIPPKLKWETIVKKWVSSRPELNDKYQVVRRNRRFTCCAPDLLLPTVDEVDSENLRKSEVWCFLDTSGSCSGLSERFWHASDSIPRSVFKVRMFSFDTRVYEVSEKERKLYGFGGTSFSCIEEYIIQRIKRENTTFPAACFILTDGMGDLLRSVKPENYFWFLTDDYRHCIPKQSHVFMLSDFE